MQTYYVNKNAQEGGEHEVHTLGCPTPALISNRIYLGLHPNCRAALEAALEYYSDVDGCANCVPACHSK